MYKWNILSVGRKGVGPVKCIELILFFKNNLPGLALDQ